MRRPPLEAAAAALSGLLLFGAAAGIEQAFRMGSLAGALLEEGGKALLLLGWGWSFRKADPLAAARGLSFGLLGVAVFAAAENLAYFAAFPEAGILARLVWSLPVHLGTGLLEALGALAFLRRGSWPNSWRGWAAWAGALLLGCAWHGGANILAAGRLPFALFLGGSLLSLLLVPFLLMAFLSKAYLGGLLHGADK